MYEVISGLIVFKAYQSFMKFV